jgi:TfoX/Sxy family transcriptional regulator of competence genes
MRVTKCLGAIVLVFGVWAGLTLTAQEKNSYTVSASDNLFVKALESTDMSFMWNGRKVVTFHADGRTMTFSDGYEPEDAARAFWSAVNQARQPKDVEFNLPVKYLAALDAWRSEHPTVTVPPLPQDRNDFAREQFMGLLDPRVRDMREQLAEEDDAALSKLTPEKCAEVAKVVGKSLKRCGGGL